MASRIGSTEQTQKESLGRQLFPAASFCLEARRWAAAGSFERLLRSFVEPMAIKGFGNTRFSVPQEM